ncbi:DUF502 domain-containing protein [Epilithonimonas ginsengisoli]|uniref:DUF502 domain-containing protein n=1 Tax=Epilithonimonas ginsengisoli TaxID=1245592 RepID=A0ABU4JKI2_9FLAO|nr:MULTISPECIES: DUF502 domain-containing protein [Chryseobacterium group]MBO6201597.1 DUF502 domain-containing protein [Chryseobacterium sp.]MBV6881247.1 DUF502 domain-containing protein [Epilithonimonas sp. FP105]MDW8550215.1 DUF502 domain-containing protein [Epilithonimonas ginsengisoli]OAH70576.1 hypothetical protein AXA65_12730 [Chryseobacterium sp. FP211-J200]
MYRSPNDYLRLFIRSFIQGLIIIGPFAITVWVIWSVVFSIDNLVPSVSEKFPGLIFFIVIFGTTFIGFFGNKFIIGRLIVDGLDYVLEHIPGIKFLYTSLKDVLGSFVGDKKKFNVPVWVKTNETPEIWRIGFLTQADMSVVDLEQMIAVYLPHSYAVSGWVIITKYTNVKEVTGMSAAEAMKFAVSGGVAGFHSDDNVFKAPE